jgi:hypothetical protein
MSPEEVAIAGIDGLLSEKCAIYPAYVKWIARAPKSLLKKKVAERTLTYL